MLKVGSIVWGVRDAPRSIEPWAAALDYRLRDPADADWAVLTPGSGAGVVQKSARAERG